MNATLENLKVLTADFFFLHWNETKIGKSSPEWSDRWTFIGSGPNYNKQGVYAFDVPPVSVALGFGVRG